MFVSRMEPQFVGQDERFEGVKVLKNIQLGSVLHVHIESIESVRGHYQIRLSQQ
jgi:hypothetical protein